MYMSIYHFPEIRIYFFDDMVSYDFAAVFLPGCEIAIDETIIGYRGKLAIIQYSPMKLTKKEYKSVGCSRNSVWLRFKIEY